MDKESSRLNQQQNSGRNSNMKQDRKNSHDFGNKKDSTQCTDKKMDDCSG